MTSSVSHRLLPDINLWFALANDAHMHHKRAKTWLDSLSERDELVFCRLTQLGLLRLATTSSAMNGSPMTQREAWQLYDSFTGDADARLIDEPRNLEDGFRAFAALNSASPKDWGDSYLAAFVTAARLTLVTFDKALAKRVKGSLLLRL